MLNVTIAIVQDTRIQRNDEKYAIKLRVTYNRKQKYYPLNEHFTTKQWEKVNSPNARLKYKEYAAYFKRIEQRANEIISSLHPFSFQVFENRFLNKAKSYADVLTVMDDYINQLNQEDRTGTAESYKCAYNSIKDFACDKKRKKLPFELVTEEWLNSYEKWMLANEKSITTVGIYMRSLRTIINIGIEKGLLNQESYPFGKRKYVIPASRNIKKALHIEDINKIVNYIPQHDSEARARDLWIFSYLCNGVNIKDIVLLQYKNIEGDKLLFVREKTKNTKKQDRNPISVIILPEINAIIKRWGVRSLDPEAYIFGIIKPTDTPEDIHKKTKQLTKTINKYMKHIGERLEIPEKITTYTARHSFATILKRSGAPTEFISESLGHTNLQTTANYLDSFEDETKVKYQSALLKFK